MMNPYLADLIIHDGGPCPVHPEDYVFTLSGCSIDEPGLSDDCDYARTKGWVADEAGFAAGFRVQKYIVIRPYIPPTPEAESMVKRLTTAQLKRAWEDWDDAADPGCFIAKAIHAEINRRGEGGFVGNMIPWEPYSPPEGGK